MESCSEAETYPEDGRCDVSEQQFPLLGKCCEEKEASVGTEYGGLCPNCSALRLPIDSSSLEIVTFFECSRYGYGRRVKDSALSR